MRQVSNEAYGIGKQGFLSHGQRHAAYRRVQGIEGPVVGGNAGACQAVEQRGLPDVGIAGQRNKHGAGTAPPGSSQSTARRDPG